MSKTYTVLIFSSLALLSTACYSHHFDDEYDFDEEVTRLDVSLDASSVSVRPTDDGTSEVVLDVDYNGSRPDVDVYVDDGTLKVRMDCGFSCDGDFDIRVPREAASKITLDSGNISIEALEGPATLTVDSGNIAMEDLTGELDLSADSGNIKGRVGSDICYADVDSGNISIRFDEIPFRVDTSADSGNITLRVPSADYDIFTSVDSGTRDLENISDNPASENTIRAEVDSGTITIKGY